MNINEKTRKALLRFQQNEITESLLYTQLAAIEKDPSNKEVLLQIANDEKGHYTILKSIRGKRSPRINSRHQILLVGTYLGDYFRH